MTGSEEIPGFQQRLPEVFGGVIVVVQVDLDLAISRTTEPGQGVDKLRIVVLDRVEKRVPRRPPVAVAETTEGLGIAAHPSLHARTSELVIGVAESGLEMVGNAQEDMDRPARTTEPATGLKQIGYEPPIDARISKFPESCHKSHGAHRN